MDFSELVGKTLVDVDGAIGGEQIIFRDDNGHTYQLSHCQDCCETVEVEDICGDLDDLIGAPIIRASEDTSETNPPDVQVPEYQDSFTWTFYNIATAKGHVTIRWYGESNGYYSESVDFNLLD